MRRVIPSAVLVAIALSASSPCVALEQGHWRTVTLPASPERLSDAVDLPPPAAPDGLLIGLVRALHERPLPARDFARGRARPALDLLRPAGRTEDAAGPAASTPIPLPLAPATWANVILRRRLDPGALSGAILADRRASLLYAGLSQLDAPSLAAIERLPGVISSLDERQASALAAFARSISIGEAGVRIPGPPEMAAAWAALAGAPPSDPSRFLPALLARDRGRLAYFFDALTALDASHQRFALGVAEAPGGRNGGLSALYEVFRRVSPEWDAATFPFYRPPFDPAAVLATLRVDEEGRLAPDWPRGLWERALSGLSDGAAMASDAAKGTVDAAWLLSAVFAHGPKAAPARAEQVRFAQRVFADAAPARDPSLVTAVGNYTRYPALMLALESLGIRRPAVYADAAGLAAALSRRADTTALASFQAALALVARSAWTGAIAQADAAQLTGSLLALDPQDETFDARLADWLTGTLIPGLAVATASAAADNPEDVLLRALAGVRPIDGARTPAAVEWFGRRYAVDPAAGALARARSIRARQGPPSLDDALAIGGLVAALDRDEAREAAAGALVRRLAQLAAALPDIGQNRGLRAALIRAHDRLQAAAPERAAGSVSAEIIRAARRARAGVIADVLIALAYVPVLGDPTGPARLGGHVARRHVFSSSPDLTGDGAEPAWRLPREAVAGDLGWHVEGALLELDQALARLALRRLDVDVIPVAPRIDESTKRQFLLDAALARSGDFSDAERDLVADGIAAGRARVAALAGRADELASVAAALGMEPQRVQAIAWAAAEGAGDVAARFAPSELLRLGAVRALPFAVATVPSGVCPRTAPSCPREATDLALRLLEGLAARRLPAALLPGLLSVATQDVVDQVQPVYPGDLEALRRYAAGLPRQRVDDYIASLEGFVLRPESAPDREAP